MIVARTASDRQKVGQPQPPQNKANLGAGASKKPGEAGTAAGKPGAATALDSPTGRRRTVPPISAEKALRMLDDSRGREVLRSGVAAGNRLEKLMPPEKDW